MWPLSWIYTLGDLGPVPLWPRPECATDFFIKMCPESETNKTKQNNTGHVIIEFIITEFTINVIIYPCEI